MTHFVDNPHDFSRYYERSWIYKVEDGRNIPYKVIGALGADTFSIAKYGKTNAAVELSFKKIVDDFKLDHPSLGAISTYCGGLVYATYTPERQYTKGFVRNRVEVTHFCTVLAVKERTIDSNENIDFIFNRRYFEPEVLLKLLKSGERLGGAITTRSGLYLDENRPHPLITYGVDTVGHVEPTHIVVYKKHRAHKGYVGQIFNNKEIKVWPK